MRLFAILLFAAVASAQSVSSFEQSYGPYPRPERGGRHALAAGGVGALLAWSENVDGGSRIHVGLLDSRARLVSPVSILPVANDDANAFAPAVSFNGENFLVVWIERSRGGQRTRGALVDRNGIPVGTPQNYDFTLISSNVVVPLMIVWDGAGWHVWSESRVMTILPNAERIPDSNPWPQAQAVAMDGALLATASYKKTQLLRGCFAFRCEYYADVWDVVWTDGATGGKRGIGGEWPRSSPSPVSQPGITAVADGFAVAWSSILGVGYLLTRATSNSGAVFATPSITVAPGLACDGDRCVIAYGTLNGDVHALAFEIDALSSPESFTIATTERTEHQPHVHSLGSGRFLVSYLSDQGTDLRINGRVVTFGSSRRRSIR